MNIDRILNNKIIIEIKGLFFSFFIFVLLALIFGALPINGFYDYGNYNVFSSLFLGFIFTPFIIILLIIILFPFNLPFPIPLLLGILFGIIYGHFLWFHISNTFTHLIFRSYIN